MSTLKRSRTVRGALLATGALALALTLSGCDKGEVTADGSPVAGTPVDLRRITETQYRQIVADVFGTDIEIGGRFEPSLRESGLMEVGASQVSVTASGFEEYEKMARSIADQVVDEKHRGMLLPCAPQNAAAPDDACTAKVIEEFGLLLFRRPPTQGEIAAQVRAAGEAAQKVGDYYKGLALSLAGMLASPQFLFRAELLEPDPQHPGLQRLDAWSKASRLSFLIWNAGPDRALLDAAGKGELESKEGLARQVDRMLASPRLEAGVRAFFSDMLEFEKFDGLAKDPKIYPKFNFQVARDAKEQTLRTIVDQLVTRGGDYRDLFTTRSTFLTPRLASVYDVVMTPRPGMPEGWVRYEFPAGQPQAGILTQASFVALHSHPGRTSPTLRGKALREVLLCQKVPDPPANVNFTVVQETDNPKYKTVRERLTAHATDATCVGCHKVTDPIGLAMENFDSIGGFRTAENSAPIDTSGDIDGTTFKDPVGLGKAIHDNPAATSCLVNRVYAYGVGRKPTKGEVDWLTGSLEKRFASDGYRLPALLRRVATSEAFYRVTVPAAPAKVAALASTPAQENRP